MVPAVVWKGDNQLKNTEWSAKNKEPAADSWEQDNKLRWNDKLMWRSKRISDVGPEPIPDHV